MSQADRPTRFARPSRFSVASMQIQGARDEQEDSILVERLAGAVLVAVADGLGGRPRGEVASATALQSLHRAMIRRCRTTPPITPLAWSAALHRAVRIADRAVRRLGTCKEPTQLPGTTLVAAVFLEVPQVVVFASVGDSHFYVRRNRAQLVRLNKLHSGRQNIVTSCLGGRMRQIEGEDDVRTADSGDVFLLASDGLDVLDGTVLNALITRSLSPEVISSELINAVQQKMDPDQDNCSVVVVKSQHI